MKRYNGNVALEAMDVECFLVDLKRRQVLADQNVMWASFASRFKPALTGDSGEHARHGSTHFNSLYPSYRHL